MERNCGEIPPALALVFLGFGIWSLWRPCRFYHLLSNSCTINIVRYANKIGRVGRLDINHLLNGFIDQYLHSSGMIETTLPFEEFRRLSHINEAARKAGSSPDFGQRIREAIRIPKY